MCLILFAYRYHPDYPLILAANRDEFHARPTCAAAWWPDSPTVLGGRDLSAGGTWLGISRSGRLAAVTNVRDPASHQPSLTSRGQLTSAYLCQDIPAETYLETLRQTRNNYNGYNLLFGPVAKLRYVSNRSDQSMVVENGIHGLSNHLLDTPWPKVERGKQALGDALSGSAPDIERLWELLSDDSLAADDELPETGIGYTWEKRLSAIRIRGDRYGTRASTLLLCHSNGRVEFKERTLHRDGSSTEANFDFQLETATWQERPTAASPRR